MHIKQFAEQYRVKLLHAGRLSKLCGKPLEVEEPVVEGKCGMIGDPFPSEIKKFGNVLCLHLLAVPRHRNMDSKLTRRATAAEAAGMRLKVRSGAESVWFFDPYNQAQAKVAIALVEAKRRRRVILTEEQRTALVARMAVMRAAQTRRQNAIS